MSEWTNPPTVEDLGKTATALVTAFAALKRTLTNSKITNVENDLTKLITNFEKQLNVTESIIQLLRNHADWIKWTREEIGKTHKLLDAMTGLQQKTMATVAALEKNQKAKPKTGRRRKS